MEYLENSAFLSSAYLAPIQYFTKLVSYNHIYIEYCESYLKQSYRNRAVILAANGPLHLTLPIINGPRRKGRSVINNYRMIIPGNKRIGGVYLQRTTIRHSSNIMPTIWHPFSSTKNGNT